MRRTRIAHPLLILLIAIPILAGWFPAVANAQDLESATADNAEAPAWLEPRGLSVLDLVGQVPEEQLRGSILVFDEAGVTQYLRGDRDGNRVTIEVSMSSYLDTVGYTEFVCLGRRPILDEWPVSVPPSEMRLFSAGKEVTEQVWPTFRYHPAAQADPIRGPNASGRLERYFEYGFEGSDMANVIRTASGAIAVPANMGCTYFIWGDYPDLTAEFVFDYPQQISVETLGSQTFGFHSYIGVGGAGQIQSLADQMERAFGNRHDKFGLTIPSGADYVWLNYPPTLVSAYASETPTLDHNIRLPSSGTYRLIGYGDTKSVDHVVAMGLPLQAQWMDADLGGGTWLPRTAAIQLLGAPEYFVPPGIEFDPCMVSGGCPDSLLQAIYAKEAQMTIYYYRIRRLLRSDLMKVPLRQTGPSWSPSSTTSVPVDALAPSAVETTSLPNAVIRLPLIINMAPPPTFPDDTPQSGCPCGWFDEYYRMLDVVPGL
jgi:hypothetical protein